MRLMLKFRICTAKYDKPIANDLAIQTIKKLVDRLNPEASYFYFENGMRTGIIVFKADKQTELIPIYKTLTEEIDMELEVQPALNFDDLLETL